MRGRAIILDGPGTRAAAASMLGIAVLLPLVSPGGVGPPCPLRMLTGIPCPLCGMTTSVVATVHGNLEVAVLANPFGVLLVIAAMFLLLQWRRSEWRVALVVLLPVVAVSWMYQLLRVLS